MKKTKQKNPFQNTRVKGSSVRKLRIQKEKANDVDPVVPPSEDKFMDEDTRINADNVEVVQPAEWDVRDELEQMDGFRDYAQESRGNNLSYGDY